MSKEELEESIISIKIEVLLCWEDYFKYRKVGDRIVYSNMKENLIALDIYIQALDYIYNCWDYLDNLDFENKDISTCIAAAIDCLRTFNTRYYG